MILLIDKPDMNLLLTYPWKDEGTNNEGNEGIKPLLHF